jgi:hypothetical protein
MSYKIVNIEQLEADLTSVADSIRAKSGISDKLDFPAGFISAAAGIQSGDVPSAETAEFGREKVAETLPDGMAWYNGAILPVIPADVLAQYPYAVIVYVVSSGEYELILEDLPWWYDETKRAIRIDRSGFHDVYVVSDNSWVRIANYRNSNVFIGSGTDCIWSSHDIPYDSASATDIYFKGSESVKWTYGDFISGASYYAVTRETLNNLAYNVQKHWSSYDAFTGAEIRDFINRCSFYEKRNAESVLELNNQVFHSSAKGAANFSYEKGNAVSVLGLNNKVFHSSAVGTLTE